MLTLISDSLISPSAQSKSSPKPKNKTVPYRSGFVYERATPSGTSSKLPGRRFKFAFFVRGWLTGSGITDITQSEDIGARLASVSRCTAHRGWSDIARVEVQSGGDTRIDGDKFVKIMASATSTPSSIQPIVAFSSLRYWMNGEQL
ncbi:MAG: hypothetical protein Q9226_000614 [Calogaya cf. arnoldii]